MATDRNHDLEDDDISGVRGITRASLGMIKKYTWVFVLIFSGLVLLEVGLRVVRPDMAGLVYDANRTGGHPIFLSDKLFRIPQETAVNDTPTILAFGDSTTFGTGVGAQETWPSQLSNRIGVTVPVANAGFPGAALTALGAYLAGPWSVPEPPEVVVLLVTSNMISFTQFRKDRGSYDPLSRFSDQRQDQVQQPVSIKRRIVNVLQESAVWKSLSINLEIFKYAIGLQNHRTDPLAPLGPLLAYGWIQPDLPDDFEQRMWTTFEDELALIRQQTDALGACLIIGFLPPRFMLSNHITDNLKFVPQDRLTVDVAARMQNIAQDMGVQFVDMTVPLAEARAGQGLFDAPLFIPGDYTHLSAQGHTVVAETFAQEMNASPSCRLPIR